MSPWERSPHLPLGSNGRPRTSAPAVFSSAQAKSLHDTLHELRVPRASAWRLHLSLLEFVSNAAHRIAALLEVPNERRKLLGTNLRLGSILRCERFSAVATKSHATLLRCGQSSFGALTDQPCFQLGNGCHLREDELAHCAGDLGQIGEQYFDAALDQCQQEAVNRGSRVEARISY